MAGLGWTAVLLCMLRASNRKRVRLFSIFCYDANATRFMSPVATLLCILRSLGAKTV